VTAPLVSIVLPTRNGAATLPALLDAIARQRVDFPFELVAVDSSSGDGTAELLRARADRLVTIPADQFDHGATRNLAIERSRGELIVLTVQDALPASDSWLAALTAPLRRDSRLAGVFARQTPRPDASGVTRAHLARWAGAAESPRTMTVSGPAEFGALSPAERLARCTFDNVCSCIRRSVWTMHPFKPTPMAEDVEWARDVLLAGHRLGYTPAAVVVHSHERSVGDEFARTRLLHRRLYELFGLRTIPSALALGRAIASTLPAHLRWEKSARAAALAIAWPLGQYLGARSAVRSSASSPSSLA
jgi:glycosyltransferase involved in cell wall biosynthesis